MPYPDPRNDWNGWFACCRISLQLVLERTFRKNIRVGRKVFKFDHSNIRIFERRNLNTNVLRPIGFVVSSIARKCVIRQRLICCSSISQDLLFGSISNDQLIVSSQNWLLRRYDWSWGSFYCLNVKKVKEFLLAKTMLFCDFLVVNLIFQSYDIHMIFHFCMLSPFLPWNLRCMKNRVKSCLLYECFFMLLSCSDD